MAFPRVKQSLVGLNDNKPQREGETAGEKGKKKAKDLSLTFQKFFFAKCPDLSRAVQLQPASKLPSLCKTPLLWWALKSAEVFRQTCVGCLRQQGLQARRISGQQWQEREKVGGGGTEDEEGSSERQFLWFGSSCGSMYSQHFCLQTETFLFALQARFLNLWPSDLHCIWHYVQVWDCKSLLGGAELFHLSPPVRLDRAYPFHHRTGKGWPSLWDRMQGWRLCGKLQNHSLQMKVYLSLNIAILSHSNKGRLET